MEIQDLEVTWVTVFGSEMKHMFIKLQHLYVDAEECTRALLWAERGHMHLFQHKIEGNPVSLLLELAEKGQATNNSAIHRNRMVVDNGARKVLPELESEKTISLISSVRALHQCFIQQQAFEVACRNETVGLAFVAGNPEPLGLGLDQLKGAAGEAEEVAELVNVEAIVGGRVTKEAVIKDLSSACLVVLVTHETLTPEEITALPGGVHTGLVVLSACQTGKGEVTSEGVFSLWRALLHAGAPAIIVSLWKVDDGSTKALIKDLFSGLAKDGKPLAEALQSTMVRMLNDGHHNVFHRAHFVVVGSPFLKIPNFSCMAKLSSIQVKDE
ncbi:hypothetical protein BDL97_14G089400 [Sphagnum fallax]|nr:hypothetical protein BDL97_14G089400 [Sphagnum fallax]